MEINFFNDRNNDPPTVCITADSPAMDKMLESVLSPYFARVNKEGAINVFCLKNAPVTDAPCCVFIGEKPARLCKEQLHFSRPLDIEAFVSGCRALYERRTVTKSSGWSADTVKRTAVYGKKSVELTKKEMTLYLLLLSRISECVSRADIEKAMWDATDTLGNGADVYVCYLRKKLESISSPGVLVALRGKGYMLKNP